MDAAVAVQGHQSIHHAVQNRLAVAACFLQGLAVELNLPGILVVFNGQAEQVSAAARSLQLGVRGGADFAVVIGKCAQHPPLGGANGDRPARLQPVDQCHLFVVGPAGVGGNVKYHHILVGKCGGAARARVGADGDTLRGQIVDGAAVLQWQAGAGTVAQVAAGVVHQQHGTLDAGKDALVLHNELGHDALERRT